MQLDAHIYSGFFNFYLGPRYAVDDELYRYIIQSAPLQSTTEIHNTLKNIAYEAYYGDYQLYFSAVGVNKIRPPKRQKTVQAMAIAAGTQSEDDPEEARLFKKMNMRKSDVVKARLAFTAAKARVDCDIELKSLLDSKGNHNIHGADNILSGLGRTKINKLITAGVHTAFELLAVDPNDHPSIYRTYYLVG